MRIQEIMTPRVETCRPTTDLAAVSMAMWRQDCGIVPVIDDARRVLGVLTDRDICMALATRHRRADELTAQDVMGDGCYSVDPDDEVGAALETMRTRRVRRLPVVDAERRLLGIVSINDIVRHAHASGARATPGISANDVLTTLRGICEYPLLTSPPCEKEEPLVAAHT